MNTRVKTSRRWMRVLALVAGLLGAMQAQAQAAKADKPEKPDKTERIERSDKVPRSERDRGPRSERSSAGGSGASETRSSAPAASSASTSRAASTPSSAAVPSGTGGAAFEPFRIIVDRNIFNPNRTGRSRTTEEPVTRVEQLALVGTMESDQGGLVAFFDGADPAYQKVLRVGEAVAGFTVKQITPNGVELAGGEKTVALRVNQQLRRVEGGEWRVSGRDPARTEVARATGDVSAPVAPTVPAGASDALRRLMEQRQKQLKQ